ncbi:GNAT domain [Heracleum sosnowskyi]|uniref:GNAT domain n=1 Tax=Heracleum sosnowskyi TaxID=360622 RepID=A0AAD8MKD6_9APIA|nr:GNAT domain [Heracleum sosnowskyi]
MAYLKLNNFISSKVYFTEECWRYEGTPPYGYINVVSKCRTRNGISKTGLERRIQGGNDIHFACCSVSNPTSSEEVDDQLVLNENYEGRKGQFGNLWNEYGWQVRRMVEKEDEMRKVAQVQAEAFYEPVFFFPDIFFDFFKAEVYQGLIYRLRSSAADRYACLVAEPSNESSENLVGVVDVTFLRDDDVLKNLPGDTDEYLYVSGIAVSTNFRRQKVATALLKACDILSVQWSASYLVLRAYEDDLGARTLYTNAGYTVVSRDPPWSSTWIGRKRRVLMIKQCTL